jgi:hypothetical protein
MLKYDTSMYSYLVRQFCLPVVPVLLLVLLAYIPFLLERYELLWASILTATLSMVVWVRFGPRPSQGLWSGALCLLGMLLLIPLFAFWAILGIIVLTE